MSWHEPYLTLPFESHSKNGGVDCWGLCRKVLAEVRGIVLPSYHERYGASNRHKEVEAAIRAGLAESWVRTDDPKPFDLVIFNLGGKPAHVGLVFEAPKFLHADPQFRVRLDEWDSWEWQPRIEGFYRYAA